GLVVYRIVQESLTNALRYAPGAAVTASVHWSGYGVGIEVVDDGPGGEQPSQGAGRGLLGLRERAALYAGTVDAGPRPEGGWAVTVTLRTGGAP
ncbi:MAG: ATP-binding protein, partial [Microbacteriaceae bacterium]